MLKDSRNTESGGKLKAKRRAQYWTCPICHLEDVVNSFDSDVAAWRYLVLYQLFSESNLIFKPNHRKASWIDKLSMEKNTSHSED